jgi:hypothetical protein
MSSKAVYSEYFSKEEYGAELEKSLKLGCVEHALLFYQFARYCELKSEEFISALDYVKLCEFITDNFTTLPAGIQQYISFNDVSSYTCNLELADKEEDFEKGKHLLPNLKILLEKLEDRIDIGFSLEVVTEIDRVN